MNCEWEVEKRKIILRRTPMVSLYAPVEVEFVPVRRKGYEDLMRAQIRRYWNRSLLKPEGATSGDVSFVTGRQFKANGSPVCINRWILLMWLSELVTDEQVVGWGSVGWRQMPGVSFFHDEVKKLKNPSKPQIKALADRAHLFPKPYAVKASGAWVSVE